MKNYGTAMLGLLMVVLLTRCVAYSQPIHDNVSFAEVAALPFRDADQRIYYGEGDLNFGDLWLPEVTDTSAPLLIFIHGGCWLNSYDLQHTRAMASVLAENGIAVWSLEYRRSGDAGGGWPGTFDDIRQALLTRNQLAVHPMDLQRVVLAGHSAGGHLALLAGGRHTDLLAVLALAPISDLPRYALDEGSCQQGARDFMGGTVAQFPDAYRAANPAAQNLHPLTVILHGSDDSIVPLQQALLPGTQLLLQPGAGHFDWLHPQTAGFAQFHLMLEQILNHDSR